MKPTFFASQSAFRRWLEKHHADSHERLVGFYRKDSGKDGITYPEALDEALCFGWIDGLRQRYDEASYTVRFTPRKPDSIWSAVNTKRVKELIRLDRVHPSGQKMFDGRDRKRANLYSYERQNSKLDPARERKFKSNEKAWDFFCAQAPWYQRTAIYWVVSAKQEATRLRRLDTLIEDSANGRRLAMLTARSNDQKSKDELSPCSRKCDKPL
ncbi:MAG: YdeI/OmpD-associated family protein [Acidobacteriota bacterium]|nr:YdeI/OmpD-associated family protein [Acidobacteriota bacterium]